MGWELIALSEARSARRCANKLWYTTKNLIYSLGSLGGFDDERTSLEDAITAVEGIIKDLSELEGELSCQA